MLSISYLDTHKYDVVSTYLYMLVSGAFLFGRSHICLLVIVYERIIELSLGNVSKKENINYSNLHIAKKLIFLAYEKINTKNKNNLQD